MDTIIKVVFSKKTLPISNTERKHEGKIILLFQVSHNIILATVHWFAHDTLHRQGTHAKCNSFSTRNQSIDLEVILQDKPTCYIIKRSTAVCLYRKTCPSLLIETFILI